MTAFVESCAKTVTGSAAAVARRSRGRPKARQLLKLLGEKKKILVTTHQHPDPDALASCVAMCTLLQQKVAGADVKVSFKGGIGGGLNEQFAKLTELNPVPWDDAALANYDAIVLMDTQPGFGNSPLPAGVIPHVVIDHHRAGRVRKPRCAFCDIRPDVGAVSSIVFSYFMELELRITPDLGATLLFAIESDLAGAAGQPGELDNIALSNLTLIADTRKLYRMRYLDLPQNFFISYAQALNNAVFYDSALMSNLDQIPSPERPAIAADFLLRFDQAKWALVSGVIGPYLLLSLRTYPGGKMSAAELMGRLVRGMGEGGGHRSKAGGAIRLKEGTPAEIERIRNVVRRRYLRALGIKGARAQRLIPKNEIAAAVMPRVPAAAAASAPNAKPTSAKKSGVSEDASNATALSS